MSAREPAGEVGEVGEVGDRGSGRDTAGGATASTPVLELRDVSKSSAGRRLRAGSSATGVSSPRHDRGWTRSGSTSTRSSRHAG